MNVQYVARTDAHLRKHKDQSFSLLEVKRRRGCDDVSSCVQETAQMAAWISENWIAISHWVKKTPARIPAEDTDIRVVALPPSILGPRLSWATMIKRRALFHRDLSTLLILHSVFPFCIIP